MKRLIIGALGALAATVVASPAMAQAGCTRERLQEVADQYRASQADGRAIMHMRPMGEWVNYNENFELSSMTFGGVIATPQKVDWDRSFYDTAACAVYVESIITNPEHPYVLASMVRGTGAIGSPIVGTIPSPRRAAGAAARNAIAATAIPIRIVLPLPQHPI